MYVTIKDLCLTFELLDHLIVIVQCLLDNGLRVIHLPLPLSPHRIGVVSVW